MSTPTLPSDYHRSAAFYASLERDDDVGAVIRATGYVQDLLLELYLRNLERPALVDANRVSYSALIRLALTFGEITDELAKALQLLAKIRNPLAHDLMSTIDSARVQNFFDALPLMPFKSVSNALLAKPNMFPGMAPEARLLRVGLMQIVLELVTCREHPLPRNRLPTQRVK